MQLLTLRSSLARLSESGMLALKRAREAAANQSSQDAKEFLMVKRELIDTGKDKRFVCRNSRGQFNEVDDVGRSLAADRRQRAKTISKPAEGEKGDRPRPKRKAARRKKAARQKGTARKSAGRNAAVEVMPLFPASRTLLIDAPNKLALIPDLDCLDTALAPQQLLGQA